MAHGKNLSSCLEKVTFEINAKLPSLNEYVRVCRANRYEASKYKRRIEGEIGLFLGRVPRFEKPVRLLFHWVERDSRRDLDNVAFSKKFILDALVKRGKLIDDGQRYVKGFEDTFAHGKETKVIVTIEEV